MTKYLVAADTSSAQSRVAKRFGHAAYHLIVEAESGRVLSSRALDDSPPGPERGPGEGGQATGHSAHHEHDATHEHGDDPHRLSGLPDDLAGVVSENIGPEAFRDVQSHGWPVYIVKRTSVEEAVQRIRAGAVPSATGPTLKRSVHQRARVR